MEVLAVLLAVGVGISLGLLGGGGSILAVPLLVYVADLPTKEAIATSLLVVAATSLVGVVPHARAGHVRWRTGALFGAAGMAGAYAGGRVSEYVPEVVLLVAFAVMMLLTAGAMLRGRGDVGSTSGHHEVPIPHVLLEGVVVGLVTGLVGAGGGFLVVPALALLGGLPMSAAVGTSLLVIAMKSFAGLAGYLAAVDIDWTFAAAVTTAAVVGSILGARLSGRIDEEVLRKAFGWFVVVMGVFVLVQQVPTSLLASPFTWSVIAALLVAAVLLRRTLTPSTAAVPTPAHRPDDTPRTEPTMDHTKTLDVVALRGMLDDGSDVRLLDVRTPGEFETAHIPGSYNVPLDQLGEHRDEIRHLSSDVVVVCQSGNRATQAERRLAEAGMGNVHVLSGGMNAWLQAGAAVNRGSERWSLERQVRLVAGAIVLASVVVSVWVPGTRWVAGFVGAGLTFAALSDTCAMGSVLARLPYNRRTASCDIDEMVRQLTTARQSA